MKKEDDTKELVFPSTYDYFHYNSSILSILFNLDQIEKYAQSELNLNFNDNLRGVSYLFELVLIDILSDLEGLIQNYDVSDIIQWSHSDIQEEAIRSLINSEPVIKYLFDFNMLRKQFATIRTKEHVLEKDIAEFKNLISKFKAMLDETNKFLIQDLGIERIESAEFEKPRILNWFLVKYNYIGGDHQNIFNPQEEERICSYPGGAPFFYIMSDESRKSYHLEHPLVKKHATEYLNGYKIMLLFFYKTYLTNEQYEKAKILILSAKTWLKLHAAYAEIGRLTESRMSLLATIFKSTRRRMAKELVSGTKINAKYELDLLFRRINNLRIKIIHQDNQFDTSNNQTLFYHVLFGAHHIQKENIEILEFKQIYAGVDQAEFSYAIFMPLSGMISDSSYWLFFDKLAIASINGSYQSNGKYIIDAYLKLLSEKSSYKVRSYEIEGNLLKNYIAKKDIQSIRSSNMKEQIKTSKGLLGQFLAYQYLAKKHGAKLVDMSKTLSSTDIDVLAENEATLFLVQAKTTFPMTKESLDYVRKHFAEIRKATPTKKKVVQILFLIREYSNNDEEINYMAERNIDGWTRVEMDEQILQIKKQLLSEGIEICSYAQLKSLLSKEHADYVAKVDTALDYIDEDAFGELD